ncbi:MAG: electron transport complex subunit RsxG [Sulfuricella sp.]|nr:electron transport complex subunit RsxG [Sulfuricella sp.]
MENVLRHSAKSGLLLMLFAAIGTGLLSATYYATRDIIADSEKQAKLALIGQILPSDLYDNDILKEARELPPVLGNKEATPLYLASKNGQPAAAVFEAVAPDGYAGKIKLLIALKADGELSGVRVVDHHETPGLGDYVTIAKDRWITQFDGLSLSKYAAQDWKVKKDGGKFEHRSGATVTPRAIVKAVHRSLKYVEENRALFFPVNSGKAGVQ